MFSQLHKHSIYIDLILAAGLSVVGVLLYLAGAKSWGMLVSAVGVGCALGWGVMWGFSWRSLSQSLTHLTVAIHVLADQDVPGLARALMDLAHGDLTAHLLLQSQPLSLAASSPLAELTQALNVVIAELGDSARGLNVLAQSLAQ